MGYDILELTEIPRERDKLRAIIGSARYEQRKARIIRFAAYAILVVAALVLVLGGCSHPPTAHPVIYLPLLAL